MLPWNEALVVLAPLAVDPSLLTSFAFMVTNCHRVQLMLSRIQLPQPRRDAEDLLNGKMSTYFCLIQVAAIHKIKVEVLPFWKKRPYE